MVRRNQVSAFIQSGFSLGIAFLPEIAADYHQQADEGGGMDAFFQDKGDEDQRQEGGQEDKVGD